MIKKKKLSNLKKSIFSTSFVHLYKDGTFSSPQDAKFLNTAPTPLALTMLMRVFYFSYYYDDRSIVSWRLLVLRLSTRILLHALVNITHFTAKRLHGAHVRQSVGQSLLIRARTCYCRACPIRASLTAVFRHVPILLIVCFFPR